MLRNSICGGPMCFLCYGSTFMRLSQYVLLILRFFPFRCSAQDMDQVVAAAVSAKGSGHEGCFNHKTSLKGIDCVLSCSTSQKIFFRIIPIFRNIYHMQNSYARCLPHNMEFLETRGRRTPLCMNRSSSTWFVKYDRVCWWRALQKIFLG